MANTKITSANLDTLTTLTVDDITIDGFTIAAVDTSGLILDSGGDIVLDAAGGDVSLKNAGNEAGKIVIGDATDGTIKITSSSSITLDAAGDIILDADGDDWKFHEGGTAVFEIKHESHGVDFLLNTSDEDWRFKGSDGGSTITALQLDISDGGKAIFSSGAQFASDISIEAASGNPSLTIKTAGTGNNPHINYRAGDNTVFDMMGVFSVSNDRWRVGYGSSGTVDTELFVVDATGNAGLGTSTPSTGFNTNRNNLVISDASAVGLTLNSTATDGSSIISMTDGTGTLAGEIHYVHGTDEMQFKTANTERLVIDGTGLDVAGIIDNTRDNQNISAPNNSDHTAGTRIKLYDNTADSWYAIGISGNTMWFKGDDEFAWYDGANNAIKMKLDANGDLQRPYGIYARGFWNFGGTGSVNSGTTAIYNNNNRITITSGKIYVPVAGRYLVHVQGLDNSSNTSFDTRIQHNVTGSNDAFIADLRLGNNGGGTHGSSSATSIVDMAANDYIHILRLSGTQYSSASSTSPHNSWFITYLG